MEKKGHFLRRTAGLLALLMALSLFAAGCGEKPGDPDTPDTPDADTQPKPTDIVLVEPDARRYRWILRRRRRRGLMSTPT